MSSVMPGLNTEALKYDASLSPHTVIVISATFKAVVRLVKTILSYAVYQPGNKVTNSGILKWLIRPHTLSIYHFAVFANSYKTVQELYAPHFMWIKDQRVLT